MTGLFSNLPEPILAAVLLVAVAGLINLVELQQLRRVSKTEFRIAMVALVGVLFLGVLHGVLLAAIISLLLLIRRAAHPHTALLGRIPGTGQFGDLQRHPGSESIPGALIYRVYGGIDYFNVENVRSETLRLGYNQGQPVRLVIFDLSSSPTIDLAGIRMIGSLHEQLAAQGIALTLAEARGAVRDLLQAAGVMERLGIADPGKSVAAIVAEYELNVTAATVAFLGAEAPLLLSPSWPGIIPSCTSSAASTSAPLPLNGRRLLCKSCGKHANSKSSTLEAIRS